MTIAMLPRVKILLLVGLPCLLVGLRVDAAAQSGRLFGNVAYYDQNRRQIPARGARAIAVGSYGKAEARTDNNGDFAMLLPAGTYKVYGQGANGYTQRVEVMGYVRAYTDTYIIPNPLVLVYAGFRSSEALRSVPLSSTGTALSDATAPQRGLAIEIVTVGGIPGERSAQDDFGFLRGIVVRRDQGRDLPVGQIYIKASGRYESQPGRTNQDGVFDLRLRSGTWRIYVPPIAGFHFHQREIPSVAVQRGEHITVRILLVPD